MDHNAGHNHPRDRRWSWGVAILGLVFVLPVLPACSGGEGETNDVKPPTPSGRRPSARRAKAAKAGASEDMSMYRKVEAVLEAECFQTDTSDRPDAEVKLDCRNKARLLAAKVRHSFVLRDFEPDVAGNDNRDPFRSYVVRQQAINAKDKGEPTVAVTEMCTPKNMVAPNPLATDPRARRAHSIRDLRLVGIVLRGTRSYALFKDRSNFGHIVRRGDCLGKEKARVTEVGAGFVHLEITPEVGVAGATSRPAQKREIQLHPEDLQLDEDIVPDDQPAVPPSAPSGSGAATTGGAKAGQ